MKAIGENIVITELGQNESESGLFMGKADNYIKGKVVSVPSKDFDIKEGDFVICSKAGTFQFKNDKNSYTCVAIGSVCVKI